jgi:hypothetical protein
VLEVGSGSQVPTFRNSTYLDPQVGPTRNLGVRQHGNVDGLTRAYEGVDDVSENDDFPDATLMTINVEGAPKEYREII